MDSNFEISQHFIKTYLKIPKTGVTKSRKMGSRAGDHMLS